MSIGMELISVAIFSAVIISVTCQYDLNTLNLINATQTLQDLERHGAGGGVGAGANFPNIYPSLNETVIDTKPRNQTGPDSNKIPTFARPINVTRPSIEKFINKTMASIPNGICIKEVP